jgi:RHH-type proline utilization regulon transcriptional repressor/proline dehydrogenase/delta 1-pyrroline-5-carboxylate dehydrogenase
MQAKGARVTRLPLPQGCAAGTFVAPTIIEIGSIAELGREQFGPILHVLRFRAADMGALLDAINASGYGLTMGVHTRIDETVEQIRAHAHVGNLYVNRNLIGAVVGVQPFGGEGLSGTGPKAGGPLYLHRLLQRSPGAKLEHGALRVERDVEPSLFDELVRWLDAHGRALLEGDELAVLRDRADACRARRLAGLRLVLPGPTGEDNSLRFVPRGVVAGLSGSAAGYLHQLLAALASGNRIVFGDDALARRVLSSLPEPIRSRAKLDAKWFDTAFGALLFDGTDAEADAWQARLAARPGPIVPLLRPAPDYDHGRLVHERSVSINTAAAGGNASLMAIGT